MMAQRSFEDNHGDSLQRSVKVRAAARLHLGFLDLTGNLGRDFGSLGLAIAGADTVLTASYADTVHADGPLAERASVCAQAVLAQLGITSGAAISIRSAPPAHIGLGTGTQLSLSVAVAIAKLYRCDYSLPQLAAILQRGQRSGIGTGTFAHGGFIVDSGKGRTMSAPPVISQLRLPAEWRVLLIFDDAMKGMDGHKERQAFARLAPMAAEDSGLLCRLTLMQVLPAIIENDCQRFGQAITTIQAMIGDYFATVQGGRYCSPFLATVLSLLEDNGAVGIGQSSWGPTGFAFFANDSTAQHAYRQATAKWRHQSRLRFVVSKAVNGPATVLVNETSPAVTDTALKINMS